MTTTLCAMKTELERQSSEVGDGARGPGGSCEIDIEALAAALDKAHDARITELIEAKNREVERRREAERLALDAQQVAIAGLEHAYGLRRSPGLPIDTSATAIGYSPDGLPWVMSWFEGNDGTDGTEALCARWEACGPYMRAGGIVTGDGCVDCYVYADFIVEHEIVTVRP